MSEKSEFQIAFDEFQKDITKLCFELAACSDYFKECSTFPLAGPPPLSESVTTTKTRTKKTKKSSNEEENKKEEKSSNAEKAEKHHKSEKDESKEGKEKQEKEWTTEKMDNEIIASSKRTHADLRSPKFMKNLKKRIKNIDNNIIKGRIEFLLNKGLIVNKAQE